LSAWRKPSVCRIGICHVRRRRYHLAGPQTWIPMVIRLSICHIGICHVRRRYHPTGPQTWIPMVMQLRLDTRGHLINMLAPGMMYFPMRERPSIVLPRRRLEDAMRQWCLSMMLPRRRLKAGIRQHCLVPDMRGRPRMMIPSHISLVVLRVPRADWA
jgi:hypothetical protein